MKISRPPEARSSAASMAARLRALQRRDPRRPLPVTLKLRGGPEGWVEVSGRGVLRRYPGSTAIYDIVAELNRVT